MLGAGLKGIEEELELAPEATNNIFHMSDEELDAAGIYTLPGTLGEAIDKFEKSELMREVLGDHIHAFYVKNKRAEWDAYRLQVTEWELERYLPTV
jgi:glutamine synthetase